MPDETLQEAPAAVGRFRLPKLFADTSADSETEASSDAGIETTSLPVNGSGLTKGTAHTNGAATPASPAAILLDEIGQARESMEQMRDGMELMYRLLNDMSDRENSQTKVFDAMYGELREYKNDFIYEHLKPIVRPLLFLFDSLEQFDEEVALYEELEADSAGPMAAHGLTANLVRQNIGYFREQLVEALRICEVTVMEAPEGAFNAKLHKAIEVVPVEAGQDNTIQRVVRSGWYLNGQLLRPAEVAVGKAK